MEGNMEDRRRFQIPPWLLVVLGAILTLVILFLWVLPVMGAEKNDWPQNDWPQMKNLKIVKDNDDLLLTFSFFNVRGGLGKASFTIAYIIERNGGVVESNVMTNLGMIPEVGKDLEAGDFRATVPFLMAKNFLDLELKTGDKIKYAIFLIDALKRRSNTVLYEYTFIEEWKI